MDHEQEAEALKQTIARLEAELAALKAAMPAHSLPPAMLERLDELDEQLEAAQARLVELDQPAG